MVQKLRRSLEFLDRPDGADYYAVRALVGSTSATIGPADVKKTILAAVGRQNQFELKKSSSDPSKSRGASATRTTQH